MSGVIVWGLTRLGYGLASRVTSTLVGATLTAFGITTIPGGALLAVTGTTMATYMVVRKVKNEVAEAYNRPYRYVFKKIVNTGTNLVTSAVNPLGPVTTSPVKAAAGLGMLVIVGGTFAVGSILVLVIEGGVQLICRKVNPPSQTTVTTVVGTTTTTGTATITTTTPSASTDSTSSSNSSRWSSLLEFWRSRSSNKNSNNNNSSSSSNNNNKTVEEQWEEDDFVMVNGIDAIPDGFENEQQHVFEIIKAIGDTDLMDETKDSILYNDNNNVTATNPEEYVYVNSFTAPSAPVLPPFSPESGFVNNLDNYNNNAIYGYGEAGTTLMLPEYDAAFFANLASLTIPSTPLGQQTTTDCPLPTVPASASAPAAIALAVPASSSSSSSLPPSINRTESPTTTTTTSLSESHYGGWILMPQAPSASMPPMAESAHIHPTPSSSVSFYRNPFGHIIMEQPQNQASPLVNLSSLTDSTYVRAIGNPVAINYAGTQHVFFVDDQGHIHEILKQYITEWRYQDLTDLLNLPLVDTTTTSTSTSTMNNQQEGQAYNNNNNNNNNNNSSSSSNGIIISSYLEELRPEESEELGGLMGGFGVKYRGRDGKLYHLAWSIRWGWGRWTIKEAGSLPTAQTQTAFISSSSSSSSVNGRR